MSYIVNGSDGNVIAVVSDGTINDQSTSLKLLGIGVENYAETVAENFVALLESFAGHIPPVNPIIGQLWYNKDENLLQVFDGIQFLPINNVKVSSDVPTTSQTGNFWYDSTTKQLKFLRESEWHIVAPPYSAAQGKSEFQIETITDDEGYLHTAMVGYVAGSRSIIISNDSRYIPSPPIDEFNYITMGINIPARTGSAGIYWASNGNVWSSGVTIVPGGNINAIQFNDGTGHFTGSDNLTVRDADLYVAGTAHANTTISNAFVTTGFGIQFPDGSVQSTAAYVAGNSITGTGQASHLATFNADSSLISTPGISTDGVSLTASGTIAGRLISSTSLGIRFPDNTIQTTAATIASNSLSGQGDSGQISWFDSAHTITGAALITTNGTDLTVASGVVRAKEVILSRNQGGSITFADGTVQRTAAINADLSNTLTGSGNDSQFAYFSGPFNKIVSTPYITTNGTDITTLPGTIKAKNITLSYSGKITFPDGTTQNTAAFNYSNPTGITGTGSDSQLAYFNGSSHVISGTDLITTNGVDLTLTSGVARVKELILSYNQGGRITFPDGTVQTTAASNYTGPSGNLNGAGSVGQLAWFSGDETLTSTSGITTDGNGLRIINGSIIVKEIYMPSGTGNGITFPDGTKQTTAARGVQGTGVATRLAFWNNTTDIGSTNLITTNGTDLTVSSGIVRAKDIVLTANQGGKITFADGTIQTTAASGSGSVNGTGADTQMAYFDGASNVITGARSITTNGTDLTMQQGQLRVADLTLYGSIHSAGKITFSDGTIQTTAASSSGTVSGTGSSTKLALWNSTTNLTSTTLITSNGTDLSVESGAVRAKDIVLASNQGGKITFADGTVQTTAALTQIVGGGIGTGSLNQLAYFTDSTHVSGASSITTNGADLTISGTTTTQDLVATGTFGREVGNPSAKIIIGESNTNIRHSYSSAIGSPRSLDFTLSGYQYFSLNSRNILKTIKLSVPLVFSDNTIQNSAPALLNLSDVTLSNPTPNQVLKYDGANWVNSTVPTPILMPLGGGPDKIFWENDKIITTDYTVTSGKNAGTFGPVTINTGVTVTIPPNSTWSIV